MVIPKNPIIPAVSYAFEFGGKGKLRHQELPVKHKNGQVIPVSFSGGIIYDNDQEIATYGIFTDLRAMQKIEEDLENTHQMLMQSEKMAGLGRLAAGVAHEINNPMSGIMLYANMVLEDLGENHVLEDDLKTIIREAERCKVPDFAKALGHEAKWKLHHNCP